MSSRRLVFTGWALLLAGVGLVGSGAVHAQEPDPAHPRLFAFGTVGIARGQTARVNVVSVGPRTTIPVEIVFYDQEGQALARATRGVRPGHVVSLDLPFASGDRGFDSHLSTYAVVRLGRRPDRGYVIPTLEVIDDVTGVTAVLIANPEG